jgi:DNA helicase-2/ATP-dependent DNA helicase PcrA
MPDMATFSPRPLAARAQRASLVDVELDPVQRAAAERPASGAMLVLGEAGHGKTAVALQRLAHLYRHATGRFRAVVIVPQVGLERLLQPLLTRLGADVEVQCYERWARRQARAAFGDIPRLESVSAAGDVARIKRARGLQHLLNELAAQPPGLIDDDADAPPVRTTAHAQRGDLQHLFGDGERMHRLAQASGFASRVVDAVLEHTHIQFLERSEKAYAHVDAERLVALDAQSLDAGTPEEDAASIDIEDYAVLFELDRLRARRLGVRPTRPRPFDCIVLDEAQEFAPLELALIGRSLIRSGTLVVAGDADQQTDASAAFLDWRTAMRDLRAGAYETVTLSIGYRCPSHITQFARALRSDALPPASVPNLRFASEQALCAWLVDEANQLEEHDASASIAVVTRTREFARRLAAALRGKVASKLVLDGEFVFHRGLDITQLDCVKGLEFDYVIVADTTAIDYPASAEARRALYVAATRARHQLALACVGDPSPLTAHFAQRVA